MQVSRQDRNEISALHYSTNGSSSGTSGNDIRTQERRQTRSEIDERSSNIVESAAQTLSSPRKNTFAIWEEVQQRSPQLAAASPSPRSRSHTRSQSRDSRSSMSRDMPGSLRDSSPDPLAENYNENRHRPTEPADEELNQSRQWKNAPTPTPKPTNPSRYVSGVSGLVRHPHNISSRAPFLKPGDELSQPSIAARHPKARKTSHGQDHSTAALSVISNSKDTAIEIFDSDDEATNAHERRSKGDIYYTANEAPAHHLVGVNPGSARTETSGRAVSGRPVSKLRTNGQDDRNEIGRTTSARKSTLTDEDGMVNLDSDDDDDEQAGDPVKPHMAPARSLTEIIPKYLGISNMVSNITKRFSGSPTAQGKSTTADRGRDGMPTISFGSGAGKRVKSMAAAQETKARERMKRKQNTKNILMAGNSGESTQLSRHDVSQPAASTSTAPPPAYVDYKANARQASLIADSSWIDGLEDGWRGERSPSVVSEVPEKQVLRINRKSLPAGPNHRNGLTYGLHDEGEDEHAAGNSSDEEAIKECLRPETPLPDLRSTRSAKEKGKGPLSHARPKVNEKSQETLSRERGAQVNEAISHFESISSSRGKGKKKEVLELDPDGKLDHSTAKGKKAIKGKAAAKGKGKVEQKSSKVVIAPLVWACVGRTRVVEENQCCLIVDPQADTIVVAMADDYDNTIIQIYGRHVQLLERVHNPRITDRPGCLLTLHGDAKYVTAPLYFPGGSGPECKVTFQVPSEKEGADRWRLHECDWVTVIDAMVGISAGTNHAVQPSVIESYVQESDPRKNVTDQEQIFNTIRKGNTRAGSSKRSSTGGATAEGAGPKLGSQRKDTKDPNQLPLRRYFKSAQPSSDGMDPDDLIEAEIDTSGAIPSARFYGKSLSNSSKSREMSRAPSDASGVFEGEPGPSRHSSVKPMAAPVSRKRKADFFEEDEDQDFKTFAVRGTRSGATESIASIGPNMNERSNGRTLRRRPKDEVMLQRPEAKLDRERPDDTIAVYPPEGGTGAISLSRGDRLRLDPGEFLNDTLIEFGLKKWLAELSKSDPAKADEVHVFSSFFYKKLNDKNESEGYESVRKWTKSVDIFRKKYIIVPINEHLHWYLAIIYNPCHVLSPPAPSAARPPAVLTRKRAAQEAQENVAAAAAAALKSTATSIAITTVSEETRPSSRNHDSVEGIDTDPLDVMMIDSSPAASTRPKKHLADTYVDSFEGSLSLDPMEIDPGLNERDADPGTPPKLTTANDKAHDDGLNLDPRLSGPLVDYPSSEDISFDRREDGEEDQLADDYDTEPEISLTQEANRSASVELGDVVSKPSSDPPQVVTAPRAVQLSEPDLSPDYEDTAAIATALAGQRTWIFTFDSLGSRHQQACNKLNFWLQSEATDKKGIDPTMTTEGKEKKFTVPTQPNYCDCGLYLIHFVRCFMEEPERFISWQLTEIKKGSQRSPHHNVMWRNDEVSGNGGYREMMMATVNSLAGEYEERDRKKREDKERQQSAKTGQDDEPVENDSDIEMLEPAPKSAAEQRRKTLSLARTRRKK